MRKSLSSERSRKRLGAARSMSNAARSESGLFMAQRATMKSFYCTIQSHTRGSGLGMDRSLVETTLDDGGNSRCHSDQDEIGSSMSPQQTSGQAIPEDHANCDDIRASKRHKSSPKQMYLDLGQRDFGKQIICDTCGMLSVHGLSEDAKEHRKTCRDFLHGVTFSTNNARVVARGKQGVVVEVRPSDSYELRQKVKRVESIVDIDLGFVLSNENNCDKTAYLFIRNKKVLGMATAESIASAFVLKSRSERSKENLKAMVGIHKIWVHQKCRKEGIASMLLDAVRAKFVYGFVVPVQMIAFSSPTVAGMGLARKYSATASSDVDAVVLVYDCL